MAQTPERSFPEKVLRAHTLAGKAHKDGAKPLTRLGGAVVVGAIGVGTEILVEKGTPFLQEKYPWLKFDTLPHTLRELLEDGIVGVVYTVANKNLGEALPKLKLRHLTTSAVGTMAAAGVEKVDGLTKLRSLMNNINPVTALAADEARMAVRDMLEAYRAVTQGKEEEFVKAYAPENEKSGNSSVEKESTTVIFMGGDCPDGFCPIPQPQT